MFPMDEELPFYARKEHSSLAFTQETFRKHSLKISFSFNSTHKESSLPSENYEIVLLPRSASHKTITSLDPSTDAPLISSTREELGFSSNNTEPSFISSKDSPSHLLSLQKMI